jgi:YidC/Oxa1 family membrane protein insertase
LNLDKTSILALIVCFFSYVGYESYMNDKYPNRFKTAPPTAAKVSVSSKKEIREPVKAELNLPEEDFSEVKTASIEDLTLETPVAKYIFEQKSGGLKHLHLKNYLDDKKENPIDLITNKLELSGSSKVKQRGTFTHNVIKTENEITFWRMQGPWKISHTYTLNSNSSYGFDLVFSWKNTSQDMQELKSVVNLSSVVKDHPKNSSSFASSFVLPVKRSLITGIHKEAEWKDLKEFCSEEASEVNKNWGNQKIDYFGLDDHYFLRVLIPQSNSSYLSLTRSDNCKPQFQTYLDQGEVGPDESVRYSFKGWFGPKSLSQMQSYDEVLSSSLDYGFFATVSEWLFALLKTCFEFLGNWGLAIILMTVIVKTIFYPLTRMSAVSMHKMKVIQPEMDRIKEKHKDNPAKQQQEVMKFMSQNKVNPIKGCLPILPTMPVFIALWRVLSNSVELRHANFFGWLSDLSQKDPYYITPVLLTLVTILQQKLTPKTASMDKTQEKIMMAMPIMFGVISLQFPSGMVLYMLTNAVVSILQQQWLNKKLQTA